MRGIPHALLLAGSLLLGGAARAAADEPKVKASEDEQALKSANLKTDGPALLEFFRQRTLNPDEQEKVEGLIQQLGAASFKAREHATAELVSRGPGAAELLRCTLQKNGDLEVVRRAERCLQRIQEKDQAPSVQAAAARLLRQRKPADAVEVLLAYLPFADNETVSDEVRETLAALAVRDGKADPALVRALTAKSAVLRGAASEALARVPEQKEAVRKLLADDVALVRLRTVLALVQAKDREAVPVLIDILPELPQVYAWRAEDLLSRLAEGHSPPAVSLGGDEASRRKARDAWAAWWKDKGAAVDLAKLSERPQLLGYTLVVLLDAGKVIELGPGDRVRWEISNLTFPLDVQYLPGERILVAEYHAGMVTERDHQGNVKWQKRVNGPLVAQRLRNGNTFIVTDSQLLEYDHADKEVFNFSFPSGERIMKAMKLANGDMACLTSDLQATRVVRLDSTGKEVNSFPINLQTRLFGGRIHMLANGHVLIPHHGEGKVIEYDAHGKRVWEVAIDQPIAATRLPNGNTLVTTMSQNRAVEFDRGGAEVWQYRASTRVTRALRR